MHALLNVKSDLVTFPHDTPCVSQEAKKRMPGIKKTKCPQKQYFWFLKGPMGFYALQGAL
jgi:hypothetical protein